MKQEKISWLVIEKVNELAALAGRLGKDFDKRTIHDFRVAFKSLRSFLRFLRSQPASRGLKMPEKIRRLYHIAGSLRDAQLESKTITERQMALPAYRSRLHYLTISQEKEWVRNYAEKMMKKPKEKFSSFRYLPVHPQNLGDFFNSRMLAVTAISRCEPPTDTQMHTIRKLIKDILYTSKAAEKNWKAAHSQVHSMPIKELDNIARLLGDYHDRVVLLNHLGSFTFKEMSGDEKNIIDEFCAGEKKLLSADKEIIIARVRKVCEEHAENLLVPN